MLIEAGQICLFIYFLLTSFNYTGNKTKMKKHESKHILVISFTDCRNLFKEFSATSQHSIPSSL